MLSRRASGRAPRAPGDHQPPPRLHARAQLLCPASISSSRRPRLRNADDAARDRLHLRQNVHRREQHRVLRPSSRISARVARSWFGSRRTVGSSRIRIGGFAQQRVRQPDALAIAARQRGRRAASGAHPGPQRRSRVDRRLAPRRAPRPSARRESPGTRRRAARVAAAPPRAGSRATSAPPLVASDGICRRAPQSHTSASGNTRRMAHRRRLCRRRFHEHQQTDNLPRAQPRTEHPIERGSRAPGRTSWTAPRPDRRPLDPTDRTRDSGKVTPVLGRGASRRPRRAGGPPRGAACADGLVKLVAAARCAGGCGGRGRSRARGVAVSSRRSPWRRARLGAGWRAARPAPLAGAPRRGRRDGSFQSSGRPRKRPRMVGDSGGSSAVRSGSAGSSAESTLMPARSRRTSRAARRSPGARAPRSPPRHVAAAGTTWGRGARLGEVARGRPLLAGALVDQTEVIDRVRVIGLDASTFSKGAAGLVEAAQLEERHAALVARRRTCGDAASAASIGAAPRRAAEVDQRLPLQQRQARPGRDRGAADVPAPRRAYSRPSAARSAEGGRWLM